MERVLTICITVTLIAIVGTIGACQAHKDRIIAEAIKGGADPVLARCAMADMSDDRACKLYGVALNANAPKEQK